MKVKLANLRKFCEYFHFICLCFVLSLVYLICFRVFLCEYKHLTVCGDEFGLVSIRFGNSKNIEKSKKVK